METCGKPAALNAAANGKCEIRRAEVRLAAAAKLPSEFKKRAVCVLAAAEAILGKNRPL